MSKLIKYVFFVWLMLSSLTLITIAVLDFHNVWEISKTEQSTVINLSLSHLTFLGRQTSLLISILMPRLRSIETKSMVLISVSTLITQDALTSERDAKQTGIL